MVVVVSLLKTFKKVVVFDIANLNYEVIIHKEKRYAINTTTVMWDNLSTILTL